MGTNTWQDFTEWPPSDSAETRWYLHSGGSANTLAGDGALSLSVPGDETPDRFSYDPLDPVVSVGGNHSADFVGYAAGPLDQREVERRADVLVYTSAPLDSPTEITGPVCLELWAASSAPDTDFTGKLVDVYPDGRALCISEGIVRASYRNSGDRPELITPGEPYRYEISLFDTSHCFLPGHAIRLEVSSSNFPRFTRNLNTGADSHTTAETAVANQTVLHDTGHQSAMVVYRRT
jgi:putative CocE/NonD family hydrolase